VNLINIDYVEKKGLIWRCLNNISTIGSTSDYEIIECVPGVEVDIDGVKVVQKFYVKCGFCCDVILEMLESNIHVRCIKGKLTENDGAGEEKEKCSDGKDNNVANVRCVVNVLEDNEAEFDYNGGEAADGRMNESGKDYNESKIENEKNEQKAFVQCQSLRKMSCGNETRDDKCDDKNKRCIGLGGASMSHPSTIRTLNSMLKAKRNVNNFVRLNSVSCQRVKTSRKVVNNVYASLVESALRIDNAKVKVMNTLRFESNESFDKGGNDPKKLDTLYVGENEIQRPCDWE
ncbi:13086_t:CDS:2, partial [Dentiscutata heterogama]